MNDFSVRRRTLALVAVGAAVVLTACQDKRVKALNVGISRDSAITVMAQQTKAGVRDSMPNVYTTERYLINGKNYQVLFFAPNNEKSGKDSVARKDLVPIVFVDNIMVGKGWDVYDSVAKANKIQVKPR
ncbi:MAG TPA: hypothetical protein VGM67_10265 [Gemmatimonadaceae bacterium]